MDDGACLQLTQGLPALQCGHELFIDLFAAHGQLLRAAGVLAVHPAVREFRLDRFLFLLQFSICALAALALEELRQMADAKISLRLAARQWLALAAM